VAAKAAHRLRTELRRYLAPSVLVCDEIGYLPLDKAGADLVFLRWSPFVGQRIV